jgi:uncharacterized protein (DUF1330 family)
MPAYVIALLEVTDSVEYERYKAAAPPTIAAAGGRYVARGGQAVLEGTHDGRRAVILEFPTEQAARDWYGGEGYTRARAAEALRAERDVPPAAGRRLARVASERRPRASRASHGVASDRCHLHRGRLRPLDAAGRVRERGAGCANVSSGACKTLRWTGPTRHQRGDHELQRHVQEERPTARRHTGASRSESAGGGRREGEGGCEGRTRRCERCGQQGCPGRRAGAGRKAEERVARRRRGLRSATYPPRFASVVAGRRAGLHRRRARLRLARTARSARVLHSAAMPSRCGDVYVDIASRE